VVRDAERLVITEIFDLRTTPRHSACSACRRVLSVSGRNRPPQPEYRVDRLVVCGARSDSRVGNSSGHPRLRSKYITSECKSVSRKFGSRTNSCGDPQVDTQNQSTPSFDGHRGSTRGRSEDGLPARSRVLTVRCYRPNQTKILHMSPFSAARKQTTWLVLDELHSRYQLDDVLFLVADADYLGPVLAEDAIDLKYLHMEIGMQSNLSSKM